MTAQASAAPVKTNGVDVDYVMGVIDQVKGNADIADFQFRASNQWIDGGHNRSTVKEFYGACQEDHTRTKPFVMEADEPALLASGDKAPNPVEFVLHGLATSCKRVADVIVKPVQMEPVQIQPVQIQPIIDNQSVQTNQ